MELDTPPAKTEAKEPEAYGPQLPEPDLADPLQDPLLQNLLADPLASDASRPPPDDDPSVRAGLDHLAPRVVRVTDPVAALDNKTFNRTLTQRTTRGGDEGFYAQVTSECTALEEALAALGDGAGPLGSRDRARLHGLGRVLDGFREVYQTLGDAGRSDDDAATVMEAVEALTTPVQELPVDALGPEGTDRVRDAHAELDLFAFAWQDLRDAHGGKGGLDAEMWAAYLQTIERYRQMLNQYDALEERGGSAEATGKRRVKGTLERDQAETFADEAGGFLVVALGSYAGRDATIAAYKAQVREVLPRLAAGEFDSEEEAVAAGRAHVGGGLASDRFYVEFCDNVIRAAWKEQVARQKKASGEENTRAAGENLDDSQRKTNRSKRSMSTAKGHADEARERGAAQEKEAEERSFAEFETSKSKAELLMNQAENKLNQADKQIESASQDFLDANTNVENARSNLNFIDEDKYSSYMDVVDEMHGKLDTLEEEITTDEDHLAKIKKQRENTHKEAERNRQDIDFYDPERLKVETPEAFVGLEVTSFAAGELSLSARFSPILSLTGEARFEGGVKKKDAENWGYLKSDVGLSLDLDLWIFTLSLGLVGGTYTTAKDALNPAEVSALGDEERARYNAMKEIYESGAVQNLDGSFQKAQRDLRTRFDVLKRIGSAYADDEDDAADRRKYQKAVTTVAQFVKKDHEALHEGVIEAFEQASDAGGIRGALSRYLNIAMSPQAAHDKVLELAEARRTHAPEDIDKVDGAITDSKEKVRDKTTSRMNELADFTNDPDVGFEDYAGWKVGAKASLGSASAGLSYESVTVTSDGDGPLYDFEDESREVVKGHVKAGSFATDIELEWTNGTLSEISIRGLLSNKDAPDKKTQARIAEQSRAGLKDLRTALMGSDMKAIGNAVKDWFAGLAKGWEQLLGDQKKVKLEANASLMLGVDLEFDDGNLEAFYLKMGTTAGATRSYSVGAVKIEATLEAGVQARELIWSA